MRGSGQASAGARTGPGGTDGRRSANLYERPPAGRTVRAGTDRGHIKGVDIRASRRREAAEPFARGGVADDSDDARRARRATDLDARRRGPGPRPIRTKEPDR
jgi:hypothetical protein